MFSSCSIGITQFQGNSIHFSYKRKASRLPRNSVFRLDVSGRGGVGDRSRLIRRARMTVTRETPVGWGNGNLFFFFSFSYFCCCCWLFFWLSLSTFFKTCPFFYYSIFIIIIIIIDCLFQTANFSWTESRTSKLFRRAELIQTPIIIPVEFKSKGENAHFGQTGYKMPCNDLCLWNIIMKCVYMKSLFSEFFGHWRHLVFWKLWPEVLTWK